VRFSQLALVVVFGLGGFAALVGLSVWQVQRLAWKEELIARIETRMRAEPVGLPETPSEAEDDFLSVRATGTFGAEALHVLTSARPEGPGYKVIAPLETDTGRRVLVDRGYVPEADGDKALDPGPVIVTGTLLWPNEADACTPDPNLERNIWFAREPERMAEALDTEPVLIVANAPTGDPSPRPQPVGVNLPNNHLQYAVTWALLAVLWLGMTGYFVYRARRGTV